MERYCLIIHFNEASDWLRMKANLKVLCDGFIRSASSVDDISHQSFGLRFSPALIAVLHSRSSNDTKKWTPLEETITSLDAFVELESLELPFSEHWESRLAESIHILADALPKLGTFTLDILWVIGTPDVPPLKESLNLYSAMRRMVDWHNAHTTMYYLEDGTPAVPWSINAWSTRLRADVVSTRNIVHVDLLSTALWRGSIQLWDRCNELIKLDGFQLKAALEEQNLRSTSMVTDADEEEAEMEEKCSTSRSMIVVASCDFCSVPLYCFTGRRFELRTTEAQSLAFLQSVSSRKNFCYVMRLSYSYETMQSHEKQHSYTTQAWKQQISSGNIIDVQWQPRGNIRHLHFLMVGSSAINKRQSDLFLLRNPDKLSGYIHHVFASLESSSNEKDQAVGVHSDILKHLPRFSSSDLFLANEAINKVCKAAEKHRKETNGTYVQGGTYSMKQINQMTFHEILKRISQSRYPMSDTIQITGHFQQQQSALSDSDSWPEKRALMFQVMLSDNVKRYKSSDTLAGLAPPPLHSEFTSISIDEIVKRFQRQKTSSQQQYPRPQVSSRTKYSTWSHAHKKQSSKAHWPSCKSLRYHDVYYCYDESCQSFESRCSKIIERFVATDTISSYSVASPICESRDEMMPVLPLAEKETVRGRLMSAVQKEASESLQPIRRSPRKRKFTLPDELCPKRRKTETKSVEVRKLDINNKRSSTSLNAQADILKKKLRVAVADALEEKGIGLKHSLFNVCGKKLFAICKAFVKDIIKQGRTSSQLKRIAVAHVQQVIDFEVQLQRKSNKRNKST